MIRIAPQFCNFDVMRSGGKERCVNVIDVQLRGTVRTICLVLCARQDVGNEANGASSVYPRTRGV